MNYFESSASRRRFLQTSAIFAATGTFAKTSFAAPSPAPLADLIASTSVETIFRGTLGPDRKPLGKTWFSTRCCMMPNRQQDEKSPPTALMLMAEITGSDYFGPVMQTESADLGKTWSTPTPVPGLGRRELHDDKKTQITVCDMVPEFHEKTGTVLAMGHDVYYRNGSLIHPQPPRKSVYLVRRADGSWSPLRNLEWNDPRGAFIYTCNCAQRINLPDGDVIVPLSVGANSDGRSALTVRCSFDGEQLTVRATGEELKMPKGRGFLEPSLAEFGGRYFLTLRAEDQHGYVCVGDDGLAWSEPTAWQFDDGTPIAMSTTQQRWLVGEHGLYLVYTRKDPTNVGVMRWRAPLYTARVDPQTLRLVRATERIVVPLEGDGVKGGKNVPHLGNFHVNRATAGESWITVGDYSVSNFRGDTRLARVAWSGAAKP
jgi:hypothetical protein